jgi:hypothetical protein
MDLRRGLLILFKNHIKKSGQSTEKIEVQLGFVVKLRRLDSSRVGYQWL